MWKKIEREPKQLKQIGKYKKGTLKRIERAFRMSQAFQDTTSDKIEISCQEKAAGGKDDTN